MQIANFYIQKMLMSSKYNIQFLKEIMQISYYSFNRNTIYYKPNQTANIKCERIQNKNNIFKSFIVFTYYFYMNRFCRAIYINVKTEETKLFSLIRNRRERGTLLPHTLTIYEAHIKPCIGNINIFISNDGPKNTQTHIHTLPYLYTYTFILYIFKDDKQPNHNQMLSVF